MNTYEFFYSIMLNAIQKESEEIFRCEGVCLKHALIKLARHFASLPDYRLDRYQLSVDYVVDEYNYEELSQDDFTFLFYYISNFQQYKQETESNG